MDILPEQLQSKVFQNLVDLTDIRNCRLVSQKWNRNVMSACRDKFHLVYPLTDCTLSTAHELKNDLISFDVYAFTGKKNKDTWSKSGIEQLLKTTEWVQFSGSEISTEEIQKIIGLASNSLKELSFKCVKKDLTRPLMEMQKSFSALRKLSIGYYSNEKNHDTFKIFTDTLEKWISLDCRVQLPVLESLSLYFDARPVNENGLGYQYFTKIDDIFQQYLSIAKLLLKFKRTLKEVQIERVFNLNLIDFFDPRMFQPQWTEMERGLEALNELNLKRLKLCTNTIYNCHCGIEVLGRPNNLKNMLYEYLICPFDRWPLLIATLSSFNSLNSNYLTSLKINLSLWNFQDPTLAINLGALKECRNLSTLCLTVDSSNTHGVLGVKNVELLPKEISILHFERTVECRSMGKEVHFNDQQIRWIIENLRELESVRLSLMIPEQTNGNANRQLEAADVGDPAGGIPLEQADVNRLANINLDTFRDLIAMPKLKNLRVGMIKAGALAACLRLRQGQGAQQAGLGTTLNIIREYSDLCDAARYKTITTTSPTFGFGRDNIFGFATLTIQRNQN